MRPGEHSTWRARGRAWVTRCTLGALLGGAGAPACNPHKAQENKAGSSKPLEPRTLREALVTYSDLAFSGYTDAAIGARALRASVEHLVAEPSADALAAARAAWLAARKPYQRTEALRFYDGPIDRVEMRINTWPIDETYVEGSAEHGRIGIIDDPKTYPELTSELLAKLNAKEGETSISTGWHVIEFLLWGKDTRADGPGERPFSDFVGEEASRAARRGRYVRVVTELLVADLEGLADAWEPDRPGNYRAAFLERPPLEALALAIKGMGSLSGPELAGERLTVAYETKAQENEHSCFSDNTVADLTDDAVGIRQVCLGRREGAAGAQDVGICDVVGERDPKLGQELRSAVEASVAKVAAIPAPFDQAMLGDDAAPGRVAIKTAITTLEQQTAALARVAALFDVRLSLASHTAP
jgi:putative iron-regulated protein